jgi:hypothetical protein
VSSTVTRGSSWSKTSREQGGPGDGPGGPSDEVGATQHVGWHRGQRGDVTVGLEVLGEGAADRLTAGGDHGGTIEHGVARQRLVARTAARLRTPTGRRGAGGRHPGRRR